MLCQESNQMISTSGALRSRISSRFSRILCTLNTLTNPPILHIPQPFHSQNTKKQRIIFFVTTTTTTLPIRFFSVISKTDHDGRGAIFARFSTMSIGSDDTRETVNFQLSPSSFLKIQKGDITQWSIDGSSDAIVNPANERMLGGGGADAAIHRAAGPELRAACYEVPEVRPGVRCPTGEARITPGFRLPASHIIHTVGPIYDTNENPEASLKNAYRNSLIVAKENNIQYIAFPAISCGVYRYPLDEAAAVALSTVKEFGNDLKEVHFVLFSDDVYDAWSNKARELFEDHIHNKTEIDKCDI